jgi:di/tricarboxylate transporter
MKSQPRIQAQKKTLFLMLLVTCVAAFLAGTMSATARAATAHTALIAASSLMYPPVEDSGTYQGVHPPPTVIRDTIVRFRLDSVNTSGVAARSKTFAQVDESGHTVNAKGARVGGAHEDS